MAHRTPRLAAVFAILGLACTGPSLRIDNPGGNPFFLDGVAAKPGARGFRYYGTTRWDALPADGKDPLARPDWTHRPTSQKVAIPYPAAPWLFPFDLPLELLARLVNGRDDRATVVEVQPAAADPQAEFEIANLELAAMAERARAARVSR